MVAPPPDAILSFAAGIPLILLGGLLLLVRPRRTPQVFFALFAIAIGAQITLMHYARLPVDPDVHRFGLLAGLAVMSVATLFLVHFTMSVRRRSFGPYVSVFFLVVAVIANLVLALRPDLILAGVAVSSTDPNQLSTSWGILTFPLFTAPQRLAFLLAMFVLYFEYRDAKPGSPRRRMRGLLIAFALLVTYSNTRVLLFWLTQPGTFIQFASGSVQNPGEITNLALQILFIVLTLAILSIVAHMILRPPAPEGTDAPVVFAFLFPVFVAGLEVVMGEYGIPVETRGFWQILAVAVFVYTLASYQLFDLDLKIKPFAAPILAGILVLFGIPFVLTLALGGWGFQAVTFAILPQFVGVAGVIVFQDRVRKALFPGVQDTPDYVHQRKMDIYRVAMEDAVQRGRGAEDPGLKELRLRHGISQQEHAIIAWMVASSQPRYGPDANGERFEAGHTVLGRYRVERLLGAGTYGRTFLATDVTTRQRVAIKTVNKKAIDGAAAELLLREARLTASLDNPYVVQIHDVAESSDRVVVVMEYADNGNLEMRLKEGRSARLPDAVRFLRELLTALEGVHERGIVHGNMKPKNILLEADGSVRLADFGAARSMAGKQSPELMTAVLHDLLYQSPEQLAGLPATPRSDLFVAGILFHQMLTKRHPFPISGKDDHSIRRAIQHGPPSLQVENRPPWVRSFLEKALARDEGERPTDAKAMRVELERHAGAVRSGAAPAHAGPPEVRTA